MIKDAAKDITVPLAILREVLNTEGRIRIKPTGNSMGKLFARADSIVIEPMPTRKLQVGTIIVFPRVNSWVAHRVVYRSGSSPDWRYRTCGDAASRLDGDVVIHRTAIGVVREIRYKERVVDLRSAYNRMRAYLRAVRNIIVAIMYK